VEEIYLSGKELGEIIKAPIRTIENWAAARKITQDNKGKYGLISAFKYQLESIQEKLAKTKEKLEEAEASQKERISLAKSRKLIAEANKEEVLAKIKQLELEKLEGSLVKATEIEEIWANLIANCTAKFNSIPAKLALELSGINKPEQIESILRSGIEEALSELSN
jgi:hypothetical protein